MRDFFIFTICLLFIGCAGSSSPCDCSSELLRDREGYLDYRMMDYGLPPEQLDSMERIWELEWFDGLSEADQQMLVDSIGGFEHLRDHCIGCRTEDYFPL